MPKSPSSPVAQRTTSPFVPLHARERPAAPRAAAVRRRYWAERGAAGLTSAVLRQMRSAR